MIDLQGEHLSEMPESGCREDRPFAAADKRKFGYRRDQRPDCVQVGIRVNDCAAVILMNRPVKQFKTRFVRPGPLPRRAWLNPFPYSSTAPLRVRSCEAGFRETPFAEN